jgi:hypothetical protein
MPDEPAAQTTDAARLRAVLRGLMEAAEGYIAEPGAETRDELEQYIACAR